MPLHKEFYLSSDTLEIAKDLLGKELITRFDGEITSGIITETEAYCGKTDKASHSFGGRRTNRTEIMFAEGGIAYVYLCYGIHHLFNVVTNSKEIPHAILVRATFPKQGISVILRRRKQQIVSKNTASGPGTVSEALGIKTSHSGLSLIHSEITIEESGIIFPSDLVNIGPRIGVEYADEDAMLPYRFWINFKDAQKYLTGI